MVSKWEQTKTEAGGGGGGGDADGPGQARGRAPRPGRRRGGAGPGRGLPAAGNRPLLLAPLLAGGLASVGLAALLAALGAARLLVLSFATFPLGHGERCAALRCGAPGSGRRDSRGCSRSSALQGAGRALAATLGGLGRAGRRGAQRHGRTQ